ncbi:protein BANP-like [Lampetra fluviatilis]
MEEVVQEGERHLLGRAASGGHVQQVPWGDGAAHAKLHVPLVAQPTLCRARAPVLVKVPEPVAVAAMAEAEPPIRRRRHGGGGGVSRGNFHPSVTLITLNSEEDFPNGTWLGDEWNVDLRVRCPIAPGDLLHVTAACRTPEKMALTLLDHLLHLEVQAASNLSGHGHHGKKQLDPLIVYGIRCHLIYKFGITECDWCRIKLAIDAKFRSAWHRERRCR